MSKYLQVVVDNSTEEPGILTPYVTGYTSSWRLFKRNYTLSNGEVFSLSDGSDLYLLNEETGENIPYGQFKDGMILPHGVYNILIESYAGVCEVNLLPSTITQTDLVKVEKCVGGIATYPYGVVDTYGHHHD